jgi:putative FmdB family regulatory protein
LGQLIEVTMPTYTYKCKNCEQLIEKFQKITDEPLKICENCSGEMYKIITPTQFKLVGKGWYETDYKVPKIRDMKD